MCFMIKYEYCVLPSFHFGGNYIKEYYNFLIFRIRGAIFAQNKKIWVNLNKFIKDLRIFSPFFLNGHILPI